MDDVPGCSRHRGGPVDRPVRMFDASEYLNQTNILNAVDMMTQTDYLEPVEIPEDTAEVQPVTLETIYEYLNAENPRRIALQKPLKTTHKEILLYSLIPRYIRGNIAVPEDVEKRKHHHLPPLMDEHVLFRVIELNWPGNNRVSIMFTGFDHTSATYVEFDGTGVRLNRLNKPEIRQTQLLFPRSNLLFMRNTTLGQPNETLFHVYVTLRDDWAGLVEFLVSDNGTTRVRVVCCTSNPPPDKASTMSTRGLTLGNGTMADKTQFLKVDQTGTYVIRDQFHDDRFTATDFVTRLNITEMFTKDACEIYNKMMGHVDQAAASEPTTECNFHYLAVQTKKFQPTVGKKYIVVPALLTDKGDIDKIYSGFMNLKQEVIIEDEVNPTETTHESRHVIFNDAEDADAKFWIEPLVPVLRATTAIEEYLTSPVALDEASNSIRDSHPDNERYDSYLDAKANQQSRSLDDPRSIAQLLGKKGLALAQDKAAVYGDSPVGLRPNWNTTEFGSGDSHRSEINLSPYAPMGQTISGSSKAGPAPQAGAARSRPRYIGNPIPIDEFGGTPGS